MGSALETMHVGIMGNHSAFANVEVGRNGPSSTQTVRIHQETMFKTVTISREYHFRSAAATVENGRVSLRSEFIEKPCGKHREPPRNATSGLRPPW